MVTCIYPKYYSTELSCIKNSLEKFSFSKLKIEKVEFFTESSTEFFFAVVFLTFEVA